MDSALHTDELVVDCFAGGGGASLGIEWALGRPIDVAINHNAAAIAMHAANHPRARHYCESVWVVDPVVVCGGRRVGYLHLSPDCTHFARAGNSVCPHVMAALVGANFGGCDAAEVA